MAIEKIGIYRDIVIYKTQKNVIENNSEKGKRKKYNCKLL